MMSNKMTWNWNIIGHDQRLVFKIPLESLKSKNKWWEVWKKNSYDFNNKYINRQIKIIKLFKLE
jgi:hypothetical protein